MLFTKRKEKIKKHDQKLFNPSKTGKPMAEQKSEITKIKPAEVEKLVVSLSKEGNSPAKIGLILRDKHGVPKSKLVAGKKISQILDENKLSSKTEKKNVQDKIINLESHIGKHKHDYTAKRSLSKSLWSVKKLN